MYVQVEFILKRLKVINFCIGHNLYQQIQEYVLLKGLVGTMYAILAVVIVSP